MKRQPQIRVSEEAAEWLITTRDDLTLASVASVLDRLIQKYGDDFITWQLQAIPDDRPS